jgi:hypothetical protein
MKQFKVWASEGHNGYYLIEAESAEDAQRKYEYGDYEGEMLGTSCIDQVVDKVEEVGK